MNAFSQTNIKQTVLLTLVTFAVSGCTSIGPTTVVRDSFGYTDAISNSWKRQMLLNTVKIRYSDAPVFMDVSSVITQYQILGEVQGQLGWNITIPTNSQLLLGRANYADRPTITYQPLRGEKFTRSLLRPIPPGAILSLIEGRYQADLMLRMCTQEINGLNNRVTGGLSGHPGDPDFYRLVDLLTKIQQSRAVSTRIQETEDEKTATAMTFRKKRIDPEIIDEIDEVKELLGLSPEQKSYNVVYAAIPADDNEIAILTRSMMDILSELASYIDVPQSHLAENRVPSYDRENQTEITLGIEPLIRIHSDKDRPDDAFVTVQYRDHWFWIDDRDIESKRVFSFLMILFSLAETGPAEPAPLVTIPTR